MSFYFICILGVCMVMCPNMGIYVSESIVHCPLLIRSCEDVILCGALKKRSLTMCGVTLWSLWIAKNGMVMVFNGKQWDGDPIFFKMQSWFWIKAVEGDSCMDKIRWWPMPRNFVPYTSTNRNEVSLAAVKENELKFISMAPLEANLALWVALGW